jgi:hypothetical protein
MTTTPAGAASGPRLPANRRTELTDGASAFTVGGGMARTLNAGKSVVFFAFAAPIRTR